MGPSWTNYIVFESVSEDISQIECYIEYKDLPINVKNIIIQQLVLSLRIKMMDKFWAVRGISMDDGENRINVSLRRV